jgi:lysosome membrane protein 2
LHGLQKIPLRNGTDTFDAWVDPPVPVYMQFWMFDLVNKKDYVDNGAKPILKEKGPYTYRY